jgi:hypothetical protein
VDQIFMDNILMAMVFTEGIEGGKARDSIVVNDVSFLWNFGVAAMLVGSYSRDDREHIESRNEAVAQNYRFQPQNQNESDIALAEL